MGGDADVGKHRHLHAAAKTKALDAGNGRLGIIGKQRALGGAALAIFLGSGGVMARLLELADVGARYEGLAAAAAQDHDAHGSVVAQGCQRLAKSPHISSDIALRLSGLLKVITPTPPAVCLRILPSA